MSGPARIGIAGIGGRVGRLLVEETEAAGLILAGGVGRGDDLATLAAGCDVVVDFTQAGTAIRHAAILAGSGVAWVLGTTGLSDDQQRAVADASTKIAVVQAANFSPGIVLMHALARRMADSLPPESYDAEIVEMHHRQKTDAPSGTALSLGHAVAAARGVDLATVRESGRDGQTGARRHGAIGFAALRGGQIVGEHTLSFTAGAEQLSLTHRAFDRRVFATGAIRAAIWVVRHTPGLYGMEDVLDLR